MGKRRLLRSGTLSLTLGILTIVYGITVGILAIINGGKLIRRGKKIN